MKLQSLIQPQITYFKFTFTAVALAHRGAQECITAPKRQNPIQHITWKERLTWKLYDLYSRSYCWTIWKARHDQFLKGITIHTPVQSLPLLFCFIKQVLIPWSINRNPNWNLDKSIGILIRTWTNQLESRNPNNQCPCGHSTVCTRSERAQSCRHQRFNCGHIYSKSRPKLTAHKKSSSGAEPRT